MTEKEKSKPIIEVAQMVPRLIEITLAKDITDAGVLRKAGEKISVTQPVFDFLVQNGCVDIKIRS